MPKFISITLFSALFLISMKSMSGQVNDTTYYVATLGILVYESIELYPNNEFKWTSKYDLSWSEYGKYELDGKKLKLKYYRVGRVDIDEIEAQNAKPYEIVHYKMRKDRLYKLSKIKTKIRRRRDRSFENNWSWLFGHKYRIRKVSKEYMNQLS